MDIFAALDEHSRIFDGDYVLCPPSEDYGCENTPKNALTFSEMRVDGVHYAILKINGEGRDDSPVLQVSPMDSDDVIVIAESFLDFLAVGCGVPADRIRLLFDGERVGKSELLSFLSEHFDGVKLLEDERVELLTAKFGHLIERKGIA